MPPFAGDTVRSRQELLIDDDTTAGTRAEYYAKDRLRAGSRTMMRFRQREAIRVIFETDVIAELGFYVCFQRPAIQADEIAILNGV